MAATKTRVEVSYDSHSDTSDSDNESHSDDADDLTAIDDTMEAAADVSDNEDEDSAGGSGMANVMAKILGKQTKSKDVVLAKAKTDREIQYIKREKLLKEEDDDVPHKKKKDEEIDELIKDRRDYALERNNLEKKRQWEEMGRLRPDVLERDNERKLKRIATQGVVQLFNAVKTQQKVIESKLKEVGTSEAKREKVMKSINKGDFLDMLKPTTPNITGEPERMAPKKSLKQAKGHSDADNGHSDQPGWKILRDDFMSGGTMKDWDKESDDDINDDVDSEDELEDDSSGNEDS